MDNFEIKKILKNECANKKIFLKIISEKNFPLKININEIYFIHSLKFFLFQNYPFFL